MREILFRGKRVDDGKWIYGGYYGDKKRAWIIEVSRTEYGRKILKFEVIPETIGQYTGLKDKNDDLIFEGDIVKAGRMESSGYRNVYEVSWYYDRFILANEGYTGNYLTEKQKGWDYKDTVKDIEILGNIHDDAELFEEVTE